MERILDTLKTVVLIAEDGCKPDTQMKITAEYEELLQSSSADYYFPELGEDTKATTFYTTRTTGDPKGVYFSHRHRCHTCPQL